MISSALVFFHHVRKSWQQVTALQDFSLDTAAGELVALIGSSGCGKSMLLRMLVDLESAIRGDICVNGEPVIGVDKEHGIVSQEPRLLPWLNMPDDMVLGLVDEKLTRATKHQRTLEMLARVQLSEFASALPVQLPGGMTQRVTIARGLMACPQILMLDEPFGTLDALTRHTLQQELLQIHQSAGTTTSPVTHDVGEAVALTDRVVVLSPRPGRIREIVNLALPHPRQRDDDSFTAACRHIRSLITST